MTPDPFAAVPSGMCVGPPGGAEPHYANTAEPRPQLRGAPLCAVCVEHYRRRRSTSGGEGDR